MQDGQGREWCCLFLDSAMSNRHKATFFNMRGECAGEAGRYLLASARSDYMCFTFCEEPLEGCLARKESSYDLISQL